MGTLLPEPSATAHLDHCLGCLSCERACPSGVQYGRLIDTHRQAAAAPPDRLQRLIYGLIARPRRLQRLARLSQGLRLSRWLSPLARRFGARLIAKIPPLPPLPAQPAWVEPSPETRGTVGLFLGCVASAFDRDTHAAARTVLSALGYRVIEPATQGCCGALPQHAGHADVAATLAATTRKAFRDAHIDTLLVSASGCYGTLRDLTFANSGIAVREIGEFLAADTALSTLTFFPLDRKAALHRPCSLDNRVRAAASTRSLLQHIPHLDIAELPAQPRCCGAGGAHFLRFPEIADPLRDERIDQVDALDADLLLTSNIGCRLHLADGLRARGRHIEVLHPITLLARQLRNGRDRPVPSLRPRDGAA